MKTIIVNLLIALASIYPSITYAQNEEMGEVGTAPKDYIWPDRPTRDDRQVAEEQEVPLDAPIDGGLGILLVAGVAYGAKKAIQTKSGK